VKEKDKPETIAVSAGRMTKEHYGAVNTPVYRTSTILHPSYESLKTEAHDRKTSMNQLCISKLLQVIDAELVTVE